MKSMCTRIIAEARTGWSAALEERARLEKRVRELEEEIKRLTATLNAMGISRNDANVLGRHLEDWKRERHK